MSGMGTPSFPREPTSGIQRTKNQAAQRRLASGGVVWPSLLRAVVCHQLEAGRGTESSDACAPSGAQCLGQAREGAANETGGPQEPDYTGPRCLKT